MVESNKQKIRSVLTLLTFQNEKDEMFFKLDRCTFFKRGISFIEYSSKICWVTTSIFLFIYFIPTTIPDFIPPRWSNFFLNLFTL